VTHPGQHHARLPPRPLQMVSISRRVPRWPSILARNFPVSFASARAE